MAKLKVTSEESCGFEAYCEGKAAKRSINCACMNVPAFWKAKKGVCPVLDRMKDVAAEVHKENARRPREKAEERVPEKKRASSAAEMYLQIFENFDRDPLTDYEIAKRLEAYTGVRPTHRNVSSYRCMYNQGKVKGQAKAPARKVERFSGRKKR